MYKRPMFRKGGSAEGGITSGLQSPRQGYAEPGTVKQNDSSRQRIMNAMGANPPKRNFNDFLINFGLDIASRSPQGNIFQTAALSAKDPYEKFSKARDVESNLMRQVGMESEIMDINKENAAAAAAAKEASAMSMLEKKIQADKDLYNLEKGDITQQLIDADTALLSDVDGGTYDTILPAKNHAEWKHKKSKNYDQSKIGGVLTKKQVTDAKTQSKFATNQGKKNGVGKIYYDPFSDQVLEVVYDSVEREYSLRPVGGGAEVVDTTKVVVEDKVSSNPSYNRPAKPDVISPYIKGFADSITEEEGEFGTGS